MLRSTLQQLWKKRYIFCYIYLLISYGFLIKHLDTLLLFKYYTIELCLGCGDQNIRQGSREQKNCTVLFLEYRKHRYDLSLEIIAFLAKLLKSAFCYFCYNLNSLLLGCQKTYLWFDSRFSKDNYSLRKCRKMQIISYKTRKICFLKCLWNLLLFYFCCVFFFVT